MEHTHTHSLLPTGCVDLVSEWVMCIMGPLTHPPTHQRDRSCGLTMQGEMREEACVSVCM